MIKAIIFDCFGVLTADAWHEFRQSLSPELQSRASEFNQLYCRGELGKNDFLGAVSKLTGKTENYVERLIDNETDKNLPLLEYIKELKNNYKIGLLSNVASSWITDKFLTNDEQKLFDAMVFSYEAGITKPDPRIFHLVCDRLNVDPEEAVMIDDIDRYCEAAKQEGMQAIVYHNLLQLKNDLVKLI